MIKINFITVHFIILSIDKKFSRIIDEWCVCTRMNNLFCTILIVRNILSIDETFKILKRSITNN